MYFKFCSTALLFVSLASNCFAAPDKVLYELQEKCSNRMETVFKPDEKNDAYMAAIAAGRKNVFHYAYFNHFSATLNRCFVREVMTIGSSKIQTIFDVNEGTEQARFDKDIESGKVNGCYVREKQCKSELEFKNGIKTFLEN